MAKRSLLDERKWRGWSNGEHQSAQSRRKTPRRTNAEPAKPTAPVESSRVTDQQVYDRISQINPRFETGDMVSIATLRSEFPGLSKEQFDNKLMSLASSGKIALHDYDRASTLDPATRDRMTISAPGRDAFGRESRRYYNAISKRR